eukprot:CAMPEP_0176502452 /NCGR_PEP_ID=MMETSP0200_2-20121128/14764_1 /TAXON_ID=947934 /ORGANISM="Chaetoceros sp., Strain GSL56" /LENGTH=275 /DNA_ID=CAMNT_0017901531 /DNA_START=235 /DNA_END=1062 /DNA_ORIENTATION=-
MNDANNALMRHLESIGCHTTQDDFQKTIKVIRAELTKEGKVMTYTDIRMRAIMLELEKYIAPSLISGEQILRSYNVWESNRHIAAEKYLYPDTIPMLEQIKRNHPEVIIAAITNGKGNPLKMKSICNYFDFCVSGEDKDVFPLRKPHEGIYKVALRRFEEVYKMKGKKLGTDICWIHIGDDLANDVGGSAKCGARSIWVDLEECYGQSASKRVANSVQPIWSSATEDELKARESMDQNAKLLMSKRVTNLSLIPIAIQEISHSATTKVTLDMNNQ